MRARALLAGGLVLGVGAAVTVAAWNDAENATGSFSASVFDTQSQSAGSPTYSSHSSAPGASLDFAASSMSPGSTAYAWLNIRTTPDSTVGGTVSLSGSSTSGALAPALRYRAVRMSAPHPTATCNSGAFSGGPTFIAGDAGTTLAVDQVPASPVANALGSAGAGIGFCVEVTLPAGTAGTYQGESATVTWTFSASSSS